MSLISIIVPVYNACKYLEDTVTALENQTLNDIEIILVNDGSTDNSPQICNKLAEKDNRIMVIHQENSGVSSARNAGINAANGEYIGFCDADDFPDADMYELLYKKAKENNTDISMVKSRILNDNGTTILDNGTGTFSTYTAENKESCIKDFFYGKFQSGVYTKIFKNQLCKSLKFNDKIKINEDKLFLFQGLMKAKTVCHLDITKYSYVRRANSSSCTNFSTKFFDELTAANIMLDTVSAELSSVTEAAQANLTKSKLNIVCMICQEKNKEPFIEKYKQLILELKKLDRKYCKKYFSKNEYIKWSILKINHRLLKLIFVIFGKD